VSYLHCPSCQRAFNLATHSACPYCPVPATVVDASADIVAAAELLGRALARATPAERKAALARVDHAALASLSPPAVVTPASASRARAVHPLLDQLARAVLARIEARPRLRRITDAVRARLLAA
jgi:hypothetical protein